MPERSKQSGDGIADVVDGVVGQLELGAVGVKHLAVGALGVVERRSVARGALGGGGGRDGIHGGGGPAQGVTVGEDRGGSHCGRGRGCDTQFEGRDGGRTWRGA